MKVLDSEKKIFHPFLKDRFVENWPIRDRIISHLQDKSKESKKLRKKAASTSLTPSGDLVEDSEPEQMELPPATIAKGKMKSTTSSGSRAKGGVQDVSEPEMSDEQV